MKKTEGERSKAFGKYFHNATHIYWIYGWQHEKWMLITAFDTEENYKKYVTTHEAKDRRMQVYDADLVNKSSKRIYETPEKSAIIEVVIG